MTETDAPSAAEPVPTLSVVLPSYNRLPTLRRVLDALANQTVPPATFEVVVVSDGSSDGTDAYLSSTVLPFQLCHIRQENRGPAAARNRGVSLARGDIVLFLDDDVVPEPDLLVEHLRAHAREGPNTVVLGPMLNPPGHRLSPWVAYEQAMLYKQYDAMAQGVWDPTPRQFYTGNASLERRHLLAVSGFDESLKRAEDVELAYRLATRGLQFVFVPEAAGLHYAERSFASWQRTAYQYGTNDVTFARDRGQHWIPEAMKQEFAARHPLIRIAVAAGLNPRLGGAITGTLRWAATLTIRLRHRSATRGALSALYNVLYYRGVADEVERRVGLPRVGSRLNWSALACAEPPTHTEAAPAPPGHPPDPREAGEKGAAAADR